MTAWTAPRIRDYPVLRSPRRLEALRRVWLAVAEVEQAGPPADWPADAYFDMDTYVWGQVQRELKSPVHKMRNGHRGALFTAAEFWNMWQHPEKYSPFIDEIAIEQVFVRPTVELVTSLSVLEWFELMERLAVHPGWDLNKLDFSRSGLGEGRPGSDEELAAAIEAGALGDSWMERLWLVFYRLGCVKQVREAANYLRRKAASGSK